MVHPKNMFEIKLQLRCYSAKCVVDCITYCLHVEKNLVKLTLMTFVSYWLCTSSTFSVWVDENMITDKKYLRAIDHPPGKHGRD